MTLRMNYSNEFIALTRGKLIWELPKNVKLLLRKLSSLPGEGCWLDARSRQNCRGSDTEELYFDTTCEHDSVNTMTNMIIMKFHTKKTRSNGPSDKMCTEEDTLAIVNCLHRAYDYVLHVEEADEHLFVYVSELKEISTKNVLLWRWIQRLTVAAINGRTGLGRTSTYFLKLLSKDF